MSIHPSLSKEKGNTHRSVPKRSERLQKLKEEGLWTEKDSTFGLPKQKIVRMKLKKEKAAVAKEGEAGAVTAATPGTEAKTKPETKAKSNIKAGSKTTSK